MTDDASASPSLCAISPSWARRVFFRRSESSSSLKTPRPPYLLSGAMVCGPCGRAIALVSGHRGGYYGCSAAARHACSNRVRVPRRVAEKVILGALRDRLLQPEPVSRVLDRVREEVTALCAHVPDMLTRQGGATGRRLDAPCRPDRQLRGSRPRSGQQGPCRGACRRTRLRSTSLEAEVENLQAGLRLGRALSVARLDREASGGSSVNCSSGAPRPPGSLLRRLLGRMVLEPVYPEQGALRTTLPRTALDVLVLLEHPLPGPDPDPDPDSESGANSFGWWRRRESHARPGLLGTAVDMRSHRFPAGSRQHVARSPTPCVSARRGQHATERRRIPPYGAGGGATRP